MAGRDVGQALEEIDTAMAVRYALGRWEALMRYCDDGHLEIDNNAAERALRAVALAERITCSPDRTEVVRVPRRSTA